MTAVPGQPAPELAAALAETREAPLPADWQEPPPTKIAALTAQRDDARKAFADLRGYFRQGRQSGWSARVSGTVLRRLCVMAMCEPRDGSDAPDEVSELTEALEDARAQVAEMDAEIIRLHDVIAIKIRDRDEARDALGEILRGLTSGEGTPLTDEDIIVIARKVPGA